MDASAVGAPAGRAWTPETQGLWPDASHALLLEAALAPGPEAQEAWRRWRVGSGYRRYEEIDWHTCRLLPAVYRRLAPLGVDDPWFPRMRELCRHMWARDLVRRRTLRQALEALGAAGVPVLVLKGEALLCGGYVPRDGRRTMIDSDVMVAPGDVVRVAATLEARGWRPKHAALEATSKSHAWTWVGPEAFELDVHRRLLPVPFQPLGFDTMAAHAVPGDLEGLPVRVPHATELLLTACVNGRTYVEPGPVPSLWVADVVALTRQRAAPIDWERLLDLARGFGLVLPVRDALGYARARFQAEVPADWLARARALPLTGSDVRPFLAWSGRQGLASPPRLWLDARDRYLATCVSRGTPPTLRGLLGFVLGRMLRRGPRWVLRSGRRLLAEGSGAFQGRVRLAPSLRRRPADPDGTWGIPRSRPGPA
jgi:hypothetical protein